MWKIANRLSAGSFEGFLFFLFLFVSVSLSVDSASLPASDSLSISHPRTFWTHGVGKFMKTADDLMKKWEHAGIDTNYVQVPERDRYVYVGGYGYYQQHTMDFPVLVNSSDFPEIFRPFLPSNLEENSYIWTRMHTTQTEVELGCDWRGVTIEIPISLFNKYSRSFGLAKNGSVWGFRVRYKHLEKMKGVMEDAYNQAVKEGVYRCIDSLRVYPNGDELANHGNTTPVQPTERSIEQNELDLKTFYAEAYYVFNHKRFCLSAGMYGDMIQLRPAGSFFLMANYYQSILKAHYLFNNDHDSFRTNKLSIGAGYGYNLPFFNGRLCLHFSAIPMLSILNRVTHHGWEDPVEETEEEMEEDAMLAEVFDSYNRHYYDACTYGRDSGFRINMFGRFALNYSFKRYLISLLANYRQFLFGSSSGLSIANRELDVQLNFGWRF